MSNLGRFIASTFVLAGLIGCAPTQTPTQTAWLTPTPSPARVTVTPTPCPPSPDAPHIDWLESCVNPGAPADSSGRIYRNAGGVEIAVYDPLDNHHNSRVRWVWERMTQSEKDRALRWLLEPAQMQYMNFENRESWVIDALTKWIPRIADFALPSDPAIALHWQSDGPSMSQRTLYEALSRIKTMALIRERGVCNYGYSHLGLVEYGGETILFASSGWQTVSVETREIFTTVWTIKEAMVIYYPQFLGWTSSCPSEYEHLKNEYYSSIWLLRMEQVLAQFVPADRKYWEETEIPFQIRNIRAQNFPACLPPASLFKTMPVPSPTPCSTKP